MLEDGNSIALRRWLWAVLIALGLLRFFSLDLYPLADTTEARYGEIARLMAVSGDWITPQISAGVPFWGKPPLSTWLAAAAMKLFGINEFAARLPSFLLSLLVMALVWSLAARQHGRASALAAAVVLASSALFFVASGAVMTDPALLFGTTLCMVAFRQAFTLPGRAGLAWGYAFFVGLAVGLLAKGPVALILTGLPLVVWLLHQRRWRETWQRLPWLSGLVLTAALSVPWYFLAELKTPGFLEYFLIGEHWQRFIEPGWQGDLYGGGHLRPRGTIWLYWLECALPWSLILPLRLFSREGRRRLKEQPPWRDERQVYLLAWALTPLLFFSAARNILPTYVLTGLPAFALLAGEWLYGKDHSQAALRLGSAGMLLLIGTILTVVVGLGIGPAERSQKNLVAAYHRERMFDSRPSAQLLYLFYRPYSAEFYSEGNAILVENLLELEQLLIDAESSYVVVEKERWARVPNTLTARFDKLDENKRFYLLRNKSRTMPGQVIATQ